LSGSAEVSDKNHVAEKGSAREDYIFAVSGEIEAGDTFALKACQPARRSARQRLQPEVFGTRCVHINDRTRIRHPAHGAMEGVEVHEPRRASLSREQRGMPAMLPIIV